MRVIACADLQRIGAWDCARCCSRCHSQVCDDDFVMDLDADLRLEFCCTAGTELVLTGEQYARLMEPAPATSPAGRLRSR